jgi:hypothetical protein
MRDYFIWHGCGLAVFTVILAALCNFDPAIIWPVGDVCPVYGL